MEAKDLLKYLARRIFFMIVAFFAVSLVTFLLMKSVPGTFLTINMAMNNMSSAADTLGISDQLMTSLTQHFHLNSPWYVQYWFYVSGFLTSHMGNSFEFPDIPTLSLIERTFPISFSLAFLAVAVSSILAVLLGIIAAMRENTWVDSSTMFVAMLGTTIPSYLVAVFLMLIFGVWLHILPILGINGPQYYVLPVMSLALPIVSSTSRYMRNSVIESLHSEYIVTVYAKGGSAKHVLFGHAMKNSLLPFITVVGPQLAGLMMGTVLIESLFGIPGMGSIFVNAAQQRDYPLIMDSTLLYCLVILLMNLFVDLLYGVLDPRIRRTGYSS